METFDDIQIEESVGFDYGEYFEDQIDRDDEYERDFFEYLNSNIDY